MKRKYSLVLSAATVAMLLSGCGSANYNVDKWDEKIDTKRTQLYVHNYEGGYGSQWLKDAKTAYEKLHSEDVYEEGKKGIQVLIKADKNTFTPAQLKISAYDLFFLQESKAYTMYTGGAIEDIDDAVRGQNPYEPGKTIESKLNDFQKSFFQDNGKYYGVSHYVGSWGLSYNKTIFDKMGFYFVKNQDTKEGELKFIRSYEDWEPGNPNNVPMSVGRDGIAGTMDDGLPETYQDFYDLCDYIAGFNYVPFTFSSKQKDTYVTSLVNALFMDSLGYDEASNLFNFGESGKTLNGLVKIDTTANNGKGKVMKDASGNILKEDGVLVSDAKNNAYEIYRNEKYLQALNFMTNILTAKAPNANVPKYYDRTILTGGSTYDYQSAQRAMVMSDTKTCMIIEGQWWENEAKPLAQKFGTSYDFGWMPLPRQNRTDNHPNVYIDTMDCVDVVRKGTTKKAIAIDFIQFVNTQENLVKFTKTTNAVKGLDYQLNASQTAELTSSLTNFGKQVFTFRQNGNVLSCDNKNPQFLKNLYANNPFDRYASTYGSRPITELMKTWTSGGVSGEDYFAGTYTNYSKEGKWVR